VTPVVFDFPLLRDVHDVPGEHKAAYKLPHARSLGKIMKRVCLMRPVAVDHGGSLYSWGWRHPCASRELHERAHTSLTGELAIPADRADMVPDLLWSPKTARTRTGGRNHNNSDDIMICQSGNVNNA
jgi:hypothetical protein